MNRVEESNRTGFLFSTHYFTHTTLLGCHRADHVPTIACVCCRSIDSENDNDDDDPNNFENDGDCESDFERSRESRRANDYETDLN